MTIQAQFANLGIFLHSHSIYTVNFRKFECLRDRWLKKNQFLPDDSRKIHIWHRCNTGILASDRLQLLDFPDESRVGGLNALDIMDGRIALGKESSNCKSHRNPVIAQRVNLSSF